MAVYKCKMCGGDLSITDLDKVVVCDYCGTAQTVPTADSEKKLTLFNRANRLRLAGEFDKASGIYENIVAEFPEEAEAYWGLCLCNYGIEYVDDPATGKKIPTCHRASFQKLREDENFELAMEYADVIAQKVYRDEAREIDRINEEILSVSRNESPYDVFICYKETDEAGERTPDSVMAQDIYDALTAKGLKVFFARISLESKLGQQYEPYIFAALNSAKIMLCVGTRYEYFHAVWVKNEWGRFLRLAAKDKSKALIPCYKDMDPYDLPDAFKGLQAQDLGKLGAIQDLVRGVEKLLEKDAPETPTEPAQTVVVNPAVATVEPLLKRAFMFLEDCEWEKANEYAERVLDVEPENGEAYLAKAMAKLIISQRTELSNKWELEDDSNFKKALQFGTDSLKAELYSCLEIIHNAQKEKAAAEAIIRKQTILELTRRRQEISSVQNLIFSNSGFSVGLKKDGTVISTVADDYWKNSKKNPSLKNIAYIVSSGGNIFGLRKNGTVVAVGRNDYGQCDVSDWTDIIAVAASGWHSVGLKSDGTVVAVGYNDKGQCDVSAWHDISAIAASGNLSVGVKKDGTVVAVGANDKGQCDVSEWSDIITVSVSDNFVIGLKKDGTVVAAGSNSDGQCNVSDWEDIIAIATGYNHTVGLKADGTVVAVGGNYDGKCSVHNWKDIVAIDTSPHYTVGLRKDGTVCAVGEKLGFYKRLDLYSWKDIVAISVGYDHVLGLKEDGTVVAAGNNKYGVCNVSSWKLFNNYKTYEEEKRNIEAALKKEKAEKKKERERLLALLFKEQAALESELPTLKGIFKAGRRKEVEARLVEIASELKKLGR